MQRTASGGQPEAQQASQQQLDMAQQQQQYDLSQQQQQQQHYDPALQQQYQQYDPAWQQQYMQYDSAMQQQMAGYDPSMQQQYDMQYVQQYEQYQQQQQQQAHKLKLQTKSKLGFADAGPQETRYTATGRVQRAASKGIARLIAEEGGVPQDHSLAAPPPNVRCAQMLGGAGGAHIASACCYHVGLPWVC
jgi:hypothetical protein